LHREDWGVRALAYPVKKFADGRYILVRLACSAGCLKEIERRFKITESVIKFLSIRLADDFVQEEIPEPVVETAEGEEVGEETREEVVVTTAAEVGSTAGDGAAETKDSEDETPGEE
jgi:small subunit ribosomal protein S6